jgi:hypothetical protein
MSCNRASLSGSRSANLTDNSGGGQQGKDLEPVAEMAGYKRNPTYRHGIIRMGQLFRLRTYVGQIAKEACRLDGLKGSQDSVGNALPLVDGCCCCLL